MRGARNEETYLFFRNLLHSFFFIRTKALVLVKNLRISLEQSQACCPAEHKNKGFRLAISKIMTEHQNRTWLSYFSVMVSGNNCKYCYLTES